MWLREDLLKSIWHAFTALDVDQRGKVSKSQLKVLSHSLCTVMKIPHDPLALEEHFKDDDEGPLSNQGYMPYVNRFILDKVREDFDVLEFNKMCWTLCHKNNVWINHLLISNCDAFKIWCIFNFLSEDKYPLVIVTEEVEYFLQKLTEAVASGWRRQENLSASALQANGSRRLTAWELIRLVGSGAFSEGVDRQSLSLGIDEVFQELILDVLKQGYMMKKGHKRKNWTERWFVLRPTSMSYYVCEDLVDMKGHIALDHNCCVESLPDRETKKCLFIIKCPDKSFEISASDKKKKLEWIQAIQSCVRLLRLGLASPRREARLRRRRLRQRRRREEETDDDLADGMERLRAADESKRMQLDAMRKKMEQVAAEAATEEERTKKAQLDLQDRFRLDLEREKMVRQHAEAQVAQKSGELEQYLQRVREMEDMYRQLEEASEDERRAKRDQEAMRKLRARLLAEEAAGRAELERLRLRQKRAERREPAAEERELRAAAAAQLERVETERRGALQKHEEVSRSLERAANKTKKRKEQAAAASHPARSPEGEQLGTGCGRRRGAGAAQEVVAGERKATELQVREGTT
ncbi:LOW QUALITY PROTEIN: switch-associated protein 70-like [Phycodurus eques]|uniref:LOW QUALITY PROTEIN: switch-associated protein 70-like n=1 Tax=Phycodurus eques TaxID=693459 RepID=UPI002ACDAA1D|nr:LOW QUALITY PROTEIN: switch-associated protein 70-like [Phycodurus eques]